MNNQYFQQNFQQNQTIQNYVGIKSDLKYADFGARLGAYLLDVLVICVKATIVFFVLAFINIILRLTLDKSLDVINVLQFILPIFIICFGIFVYRGRKDANGSSFGRKKTNIKVVDENGNEISMGKSFLRQFLNMILNGTGIIFLINIILIASDEKKQTLTDKILKTVVVYK